RDAERVRAGHDDRPGVAGHDEVLVGLLRPLGQQAALLAVEHHGLHDVGHDVRCYERHERGPGPVDVPAGVVLVDGHAAGRVDRVVEAAVLAVDVAGHVRALHHVVQRGVELLGVRGAATGHLHPVQHGVPVAVGGGPHRVQVEAGLFGGQVLLGVGDAHVGHADLEVHRRVRGGVERDVAAGVHAGRARGAVADGATVPGAATGGGPVELDGEEDRERLGRTAEAAGRDVARQLATADGDGTAAVAGRAAAG